MVEAGVAPEETLMIGDSDIDIKTARNAGAWALGCTFGLSPESVEASEPDVLVDHAEEWLLALGAKEADNTLQTLSKIS
jgi:phosphoglycolate phosphatase